MLNVTVHDLADVTIIRCQGRLYAEDGAALRAAVQGRQLGPAAVLDLAEITALDAGGLGLLVSLQNRAAERGTKLKLMNLTPRVEEVLALTRLRGVLDVCSVQEVLELLCRGIGQARAAAAAVARVPREIPTFQ